MTRRSGPKAASRIAIAKCDLRTDYQASSRNDLIQHRARRDAAEAVTQLYRLLDAYEAGELTIDSFAYEVGHVGSILGGLAVSGELAS